jgi:hypothetical protein
MSLFMARRHGSTVGLAFTWHFATNMGFSILVGGLYRNIGPKWRIVEHHELGD